MDLYHEHWAVIGNMQLKSPAPIRQLCYYEMSEVCHCDIAMCYHDFLQFVEI